MCKKKYHLALTKQAEVPRSMRHWASRLSNLPGSTRGRTASSWGLLNRQVAVSPLQWNNWLKIKTQNLDEMKYFDWLEEMVELCNAATGPLKSAVSVTQIAHDVAVLPATTLSTGSTQVAGRWRTIVNRSQSVVKINEKWVRGGYFDFPHFVSWLTSGRLREQRRWCQRIHQCPQRWLHCWLSRDAC